MELKITLILALFPLLPSVSHGYHVMFVHEMGTKSHLLQLFPIVESLLARGHEVTGVFYSPSKISHNNYTEILIPNVMADFQKEISKIYMEEGGQSLWNMKLWSFAYRIWDDIIDKYSMMTYNKEEIQAMIKNGKKVDAIIAIPWQFLFMPEVFDCPLITFSPAGPLPTLLAETGNEINLSIQPLINARHIEPMTLAERIQNHLFGTFIELYSALMTRWAKQAREKALGHSVLSFHEIVRKRFTVFLSSSHPVTHGAWSYGPNVIEVGGLNIQEPKPLPEDLKKFMDSATDGVILVSFGSALTPSQMKKEKLDMFLGMFRTLKQYSFIWKCDVDIEDLPGNVKILNWLPQQDLIAHENLKVFVTHGGIGSLTEAIYHKATLVGIPFGQDQRPNLLRAEKHGYAVLLEYETLTEASLTSSVQKAIESPQMAAALDRAHKLYTDREMKPAEKATWWIEYVCRNGMEAGKMLKPIFSDIPWYQYHHLDSLLILVIILSLIVGLFVGLCKCCRRCCCSTKKQKEE